MKRLLGVIKLVKGHWYIWFGEKIYDSLQGVFEPWIAAWIIAAIVRWDKQGVIFGAFALLLAKLIQQGYAIAATFSGYTLMSYLDHYLSAEFFKKYLHFDNNRTESIWTGKINSIVTRGVEWWINIVYDTFPHVIAEVLTILIGFVIIFVSVPVVYSLVLLLLFAVTVGLMAYAQSKVHDSRTEAWKMVTELQRKRTQIIMSKFEIFQNNKLEHELSLSQVFITSIKNLLIRSNVIIDAFNGAASIMMMLVQAGIYLVIGIGVMRGDYTIATLVLLSGLTMTVYKYFWNIQRSMNSYNRYMVWVDQLLDLMDNTPLIQEHENLPFFVCKWWDIQIEKLGFAYSNTKQIFDEFSLTLAGGKKYALVGPSGGGKTTLMKLIAGYIHPNFWSVAVDGQKLSEITLQSYYRHIWYLTQEPNIFDGTILENLTYALSEDELLSDQLPSRIQEVIKLAKCDFVFEFKNQLETEIWERWIKLSGGQKQRLAIAKIMLKNPEIILLDEPTSALDSINEETITEALENLFKDRTVIVVAHRLQTVKQSDVIFYIEDGKILEQGSHNDLVAHAWKYKKMLDLQSGF